MPEVQTVTGRVPSDALGFVLPHEHTGIALWHIPDRWDYWELTVDDAVILPSWPGLPRGRRRDARRPHPAGRRA